MREGQQAASGSGRHQGTKVQQHSGGNHFLKAMEHINIHTLKMSAQKLVIIHLHSPRAECCAHRTPSAAAPLPAHLRVCVPY
eukprot:1159547-Pelagomonas_calceolata.AAC.9